jgi:hypothetical protein
MRSLGTRRAVQVAGAATVAVLALAGCSAGQVAETAILQTPISGLNAASVDGSLLIRNLQVVYNGPAGYPADGDAPISVTLLNSTHNPITVAISSRPVDGQAPAVDVTAIPTEAAGVVSAKQIGVAGDPAVLTPSAEPEPSGSGPSGDPAPTGPTGAVDLPEGPSSAPSTGASAVPTGAPLAPARFTIPALSSLSFQPGDKSTLLATGLSAKLIPGSSLALTVEVSTSTVPLQIKAPVEVPVSPAPRVTGVGDENAEE